jgi:hypothetical protein
MVFYIQFRIWVRIGIHNTDCKYRYRDILILSLKL